MFLCLTSSFYFSVISHVKKALGTKSSLVSINTVIHLCFHHYISPILLSLFSMIPRVFMSKKSLELYKMKLGNLAKRSLCVYLLITTCQNMESFNYLFFSKGIISCVSFSPSPFGYLDATNDSNPNGSSTGTELKTLMMEGCWFFCPTEFSINP